jgi:hypothetical protein
MRPSLSSERLSSFTKNRRSSTIDQPVMKPYSAKIMKNVGSKETLSNLMAKELKIKRSSQFSHIIPKKPSSSLPGAWLLWVRVSR